MAITVDPVTIDLGEDCCCEDCDCSDCETTPTRLLTITGTDNCDQAIELTCNDSWVGGTDLADAAWMNADPIGYNDTIIPPGPCEPNGTAPDSTPYLWAFFCTDTTAYLYFEPAVGLGTPMVFEAVVYECSPLYAEFDLTTGLININQCCEYAGAVTGIVTDAP